MARKTFLPLFVCVFCIFLQAQSQTVQLYAPNATLSPSSSSGGVGIGSASPDAALGIAPTVNLTVPAFRIEASDNNSTQGYSFAIQGHPTPGTANTTRHVQLTTGESSSRMTLKAAEASDFAPRLQMIGPGDNDQNVAGWAIFDYGSRNVFLPDAAFKMRFVPNTGNIVDMIHADGAKGVYLAPSMGNVGVGTTLPHRKLEVSGNNEQFVRVSSTDDALTGIELMNALSTPTNPTDWRMVNEAGKLQIERGNDNFTQELVSLLTLDSQTKAVGVGTNTPQGNLHISGGEGSALVLIEADSDNSDESHQPLLLFSQDGGNTLGGMGYLNSENALSIVQTTDAPIKFHTNNLERMVLSESGQLGIGTSVPRHTVHVHDASNSFIQFTTDQTAGDVSDGLLVGVRQDTAYVLSFETAPMYIGTSTTPSVSIDYFGNVGIGTQEPQRPLEVAGSTRFHSSIEFFKQGYATTEHDYYISNSLGDLVIFGSDNDYMASQSLAKFDRAGDPYQFQVFGNALANGVWYTSDRRFKSNIETLPNALDKIMQLEGVSYLFKTDDYPTWNFDTTPQIGFIAQDVERVFPELIKTNENGYKAVNYIQLVPVLVEAVKEQEEHIRGLEAEVNRIDALEAQVAQLETLVEQLTGSSVKASTNTQQGNRMGSSTLQMDKAILKQNQPNPFSDQTDIQFYLPTTTQHASIQLSTIQGDIVRTYPISTQGHGELTINFKGLAQGTYFYSLFVNGKRVETKRMVYTY